MQDNIPEDVSGLRAEIESHVEQLIAASKEFEDNPVDQTREKYRLAKEKVNFRFWSLLFLELECVLASNPDTKLDFNVTDTALFNFGYVDNRLYPKGFKDYDLSSPGKEFLILFMTEWLERMDSECMEIFKMQGLQQELTEIDEDVADFTAKIVEIDQERVNEAEMAKGAASPLVGHYRNIESSRVVNYVTAQIKRQRSLNREETTRFIKSSSDTPGLIAELDALIGRTELRSRLDAFSNRIFELQVKIKDLEIEKERLTNHLNNTEEKQRVLFQERKVRMEERLLEVKEDIELCSRWGKSETYAALMTDKALNSKTNVIETVKRIEDFDPGIFNNRRVDLKGKPLILVTPGTGNGSYDYRSNTLIIPITSPVSLLESVAYGLALYRRDIDKEVNDQKLWYSFFNPDVWRSIKDKPRPTRFRHQMAEFVYSYIRWITKESQGNMVLDSSIRNWFEENLAPDKRGPIIPREIRSIKVSELDSAIWEHERRPMDYINAYNLGMLHFRKNNPEKAFEYNERSLDMKTNFIQAKWAKAVLMIEHGADIPKLRSLTPVQRLMEAKSNLIEFTRHYKNWWCLKAQEHIRHIDESLRRR